MSSTRHKVSLCMIVKNETESILACLDSARHLVQEILVVDTGSTDNTIDIASAAGAIVVPFTWQDDFAAARNCSVANASGDWLLIMDADEVLEPVTNANFEQLLAATAIEGYFINIHSLVGDGQQFVCDQAVRLFRNRPAYRFAGPIHEQVAGAIKEHNHGGGLALSPLSLRHYGYLDATINRKEKRRRNAALIEHALKSTPQNPFLIYSLAIENIQSGDFSGAEALLQEAIAVMRGHEGYFRHVLFLLLFCLYHSGKFDQLKSGLEKASLMYPDDADIRLFGGLLSLSENKQEAALADLGYAAIGGSEVVPDHVLHSMCGDLSDKFGRYEESIEWYIKALITMPNNLYPLRKLLDLANNNRIKINWRRLCTFADPSKLQSLSRQLYSLGEHQLSLTASLLTMLHCLVLGDLRSLAIACSDYTPKLCPTTPVKNQRPEENYLSVTAEEIALIACLANKSIAQPSAILLQTLEELILSSAEMITHIFVKEQPL